MAQEPKPPLGVDDRDIDRFIELAKHEETILNDRVNIFLVAESILLVFTAEVSQHSDDMKKYAVGAGVTLTLVWFLTSFRQEYDLRAAAKAMRLRWAAFDPAYKSVPSWLKWFALVLLVYGLPALFLALWYAVFRNLPAGTAN